MPSFETRRRVPFSPTEMYNLVADVERYPEFLPLCTGLRVLSREASEGDVRSLVAVMDVGYKAIHERFTSRVTMDDAAHTVRAALVDGPFRQLDNRWWFEPAGTGCDVHFAIAYEFKSTLLQMLMGSVFDQAFRRFAQAFEDRAHAVYGRRPGVSAVTS